MSDPDVAAELARVVAQLPGGGEPRPGQRQMAEAVAAAIERNEHLVVQAGTGTGKSLAYLVPAILSGRTTVVATATKALQDQLSNKDLPFLAAHLGRPFRFAVLKGRSNYFCLDKARDMGQGDEGGQLELADLADVDTGELGALGKEVVRILRWVRTSRTGDRAELPFEPRPAAWARLSVSARDCPGAARCPMGEHCYAEQARRAAEEADVIVVNTHLYAAHLASGGQVLPPHDVLVVDETHELEDVVASALGVELTAGRLVALARSLRGLLPADASEPDALEQAATTLSAALEPHLDHRLPNGAEGELAEAIALVGQRVARATEAVRSVEAEGGEAAGRRLRALQAASTLAEDLVVVAAPDPALVAWVEGPAHGPVLRVAPVDVSSLLAARLWSSDLSTAVLTSATVPAALPDRVGLETGSYQQLDVGSPFDFEHHALLYCAADLPDPRQPGYEDALHAELEALIRAAEGRTLALFTSWRAMRAAADRLRDRLPWRVLTQDELPKPALVTAFAADESSCLFATMGFWQGVDVPGPALSLVVIDRIPFPRPDEPLHQARRDRAGPSAFRLVDLPRATTLLAQGAGRLIRTATDRGVVAVLDRRLAHASYRWDLVRALPPMRRTRRRDDVEAFFVTAADEAIPAAAPAPG